MAEYEIHRDENYEYWVNGDKKPSVTAIMDAVGLYKNKEWFTPESAIRGRHIHQICEFIDLGCLDWDSVHPDYKGYVKAYQDFLQKVKPKWSHVEHSFYSPDFGYCGTLDRCGLVMDVPTILDIKTGAVSDNTGVQLAAYANAPGMGDSHVLQALHLQKNGKWKMPEAYSYRKGWDVFRACLKVYAFNQRGFK